MLDLIYGKDDTKGVVSVSAGAGAEATLYVQDAIGKVSAVKVPNKHWILYQAQHSPKMSRLTGNQPYKWLMEYDSLERRTEILKSTRQKNLSHWICRDDKEAYMLRSGVTYFKGLKVSDVSVLSFDLEHSYGIGNSLDTKGHLYIITNTFRNPQGIQRKQFCLDEYPTEKDMLEAWISWVLKIDPSILVGHNLFGHDWRILRFASQKLKVPLSLGRDQSEAHFDHRFSLFRKDGSQQ